jgi:hypothetical protein
MSGRHYSRTNTGTPRTLSITLQRIGGNAGNFNASFFTSANSNTPTHYEKLNLGTQFTQYRLDVSNFGSANRRFVDFVVKSIATETMYNTLIYNYISN